MRLLTIVTISVAGILLASTSGQEAASQVEQNTDGPDLSLSLHYLDGLSAASNGNLPSIRFQRDGCHLSLLLTNKTGEVVTLWKPYCPQGDDAMRLEFKKAADSKTIGIAHTTRGYTGGMGIPKTFQLLPGNSLVHRIDLSRYWSLPFVLNDGDDTTVFVRAVYKSDKVDPKQVPLAENAGDVWVGEIATEWQQVRLTNASERRIETKNQTNILD